MSHEAEPKQQQQQQRNETSRKETKKNRTQKLITWKCEKGLRCALLIIIFVYVVVDLDKYFYWVLCLLAPAKGIARKYQIHSTSTWFYYLWIQWSRIDAIGKIFAMNNMWASCTHSIEIQRFYVAWHVIWSPFHAIGFWFGLSWLIWESICMSPVATFTGWTQNEQRLRRRKKNQIILKRHNLLSLAWLRYFVVAPINTAAMGTIHTPNLIMNRLVVLVSAIPVRFDKCLKRLCDAKCNEIASAGFMTKKYERINRRI